MGSTPNPYAQATDNPIRPRPPRSVLKESWLTHIISNGKIVHHQYLLQLCLLRH